MNTDLRKKIKNVKKHRDDKLATMEIKRNYLISEPNYRTTNFFTENLLAIEMKKQRMFYCIHKNR